MDEFDTMTPLEWLQRTGKSREELARVTMVSDVSARRWFIRGENARSPSPTVQRLLKLDQENRELKEKLRKLTGGL